jgi:hypothetical protein
MPEHAKRADSPQELAVSAAYTAWHEATRERAKLGGYVPLNHPNHPSRWSRERRDTLRLIDAEVVRTKEVLRLAMRALREC